MKSLTGKERLTRIFNRQEIDRIPVWMLFPGKPWNLAANVFESPSYEQVNRVIYSQTDIIDRLNYQNRLFLNAHPSVVEHQEGARRSVTYKDKTFQSDTVIENGRKVVIPLCKSIEDLETILEFPFQLDVPDTTTYDADVAALGDRGVPCIMEPGPLTFTHSVFDETEFAIVNYTEQKRMKACMDELQRRCLAYYKQFLERGLGDIYWIDGCEYVLPPTLGPQFFSYYATEYYRQLVDLVRSYGKKSMIHSHGCVGSVLKEFKEIGMDSIHPLEPPPMGDVTLAQAREVLGPDTILVGNIEYSDLFHGFSEDEIAQKTLDIIEESRKGPVILAISASPIVEELPPNAARNYLRIIETCLTQGWY